MTTETITRSRVRSGPVSRYDGGYDAQHSRQRPRTARRLRLLRTKVAAIPDPMEPGKRLKAVVNRRVDILEEELSHRRIGQAAYAVGRIAQAVFERAAGSTGTSSIREADRVDCTLVRELAMIYRIDSAQVVVAYEAWIQRTLGPKDAEILRRVLRDGVRFRKLAEASGKGGREGASYFAERFRDACETLAHALAARGKARAAIRGHRSSPAPGEEYDRAGCLVPAGEGYRVADDPDRLAHLQSTPAPGAASASASR